MKVVADSSILISLSNINRLELLPRRFHQGIFVPEAVWREIVEAGHGRPGADAVHSASWITRQNVQNRALVITLETTLDGGEAEVIALAQEIQANLTLLDEKEARKVARRLGLPTLGTVGMLIWATKQKIIPSLRVELDRLREEGGFRLGEDVYQIALQQVGEA